MRFLLLSIFIIGIVSCAKKSKNTCEVVPLKTLVPYHIGAAFNLSEYSGSPKMQDVCHEHFNSLTPENAFKFSSLRPFQNDFFWTEADSFSTLAQRNQLRLHGHTLIWHQQTPAWLETYAGNFTKLMQDHIKTVVSRYKDDIKSWDVVNEAINDDGTLRGSIWAEKVGTDYIFKAFKAAHEADPQAELFYNDFNLALNPKKLDAAIRLCQALEQRGIPVAGIGMQMHIANFFPDKNELARAVEKIWKAGFKVHFSELDVSLNILGDKTVISESDLHKQREKFYEVVSVYDQIPKQYQFGITLWGVGDADSWLPSYYNRIDGGLLFNEAYEPKPAYCGFKNALQ